MGLFDGVACAARTQRRLGRRRRPLAPSGSPRARRLRSGAVGRGGRQGLRDLRRAALHRRRGPQPGRQRAPPAPRDAGDRDARRPGRRRIAAQTTRSPCPSAISASCRRARPKPSRRGSRPWPTLSRRTSTSRGSARSRATVRLSPPGPAAPALRPPGQRIALARDAAFSFIYPHLLTGWRRAGAEIAPSRRSPTSRRRPIATSAGCPAAIPNCTPAGSRRAAAFATGSGALRRRGRSTASAAAIWRWAKASLTPPACRTRWPGCSASP